MTGRNRYGRAVRLLFEGEGYEVSGYRECFKPVAVAEPWLEFTLRPARRSFSLEYTRVTGTELARLQRLVGGTVSVTGYEMEPGSEHNCDHVIYILVTGVRNAKAKK